jgi:beta-glucosidase
MWSGPRPARGPVITCTGSADLDLLSAANLDVYRFSTSWARVMPDGRGSVNAAGLDFYDRLVDGLLARGLKPAATLYHWELPSPLADLGGWRNRDMAGWFADFTEVVMQRIGDRVWSAAPINEPWCVAWLSHFLGHHAPGLRDIRAAARAMHHVGLAHGHAIQVMRGLGMQNLGAVATSNTPTRPTTAPRRQRAPGFTTASTIAGSSRASSRGSTRRTCWTASARTCLRTGRTTWA